MGRMLCRDEVDAFYRTLREERQQPLPGEHRLSPEEAERQFWQPRREAAERERAKLQWHLAHDSTDRTQAKESQ
jgi:hypothetical protein